MLPISLYNLERWCGMA